MLCKHLMFPNMVTQVFSSRVLILVVNREQMCSVKRGVPHSKSTPQFAKSKPGKSRRPGEDRLLNDIINESIKTSRILKVQILRWATAFLFGAQSLVGRILYLITYIITVDTTKWGYLQ